MSTPARYTASVISMRSCEGTGEWNLYSEDPLPQRDSLADTIRQSFRAFSAIKIQQGAVPRLIEIRSEAGLVALADVEILRHPARIKILWRSELSLADAAQAQLALEHNRKKTEKMVFDVTDVAYAEGGAINVKYLTLLLESQRFVEPAADTMRLIFQIERELGGQTNRVKRLEDDLGL